MLKAHNKSLKNVTRKGLRPLAQSVGICELIYALEHTLCISCCAAAPRLQL